MRISIRIGLTNETSIFPHTDKIHSPCINADRGNLNITPLSDYFQPFDNIPVKFIDIPVEMSAGFNQTVRETVYVFHFQSLRREGSQDSTATGSAQIDRKKTLFHGN